MEVERKTGKSISRVQRQKERDRSRETDVLRKMKCRDGWTERERDKEEDRETGVKREIEIDRDW